MILSENELQQWEEEPEVLANEVIRDITYEQTVPDSFLL